MSLLWHYLKQYRWLLIGSLCLAAINQIFSLLDPQIFRQIIDNYATKFDQLSRQDFLSGILWLTAASVGVAFVSRVAKNFQDYLVNVIVQKLGAKMYADAIAHSFSLPYQVFEDQRSGEFLQKLQKAKTDSQALISGAINVLFFSVIGVGFVLVYAFLVNWLIGLVYFLMIPVLGAITFTISGRIKIAQQKIIAESAELAGSTTETIRNVELVKSLGLENQEINRLNEVNEQILKLELKKIKMVRALSFIQGTMINGLRSVLLLLMLWLIYTHSISLGQFFSLLFYSFFIFNPLGELGNVAQQYQEARASLSRLEEILAIKPEPQPSEPIAIERIDKIRFENVSFDYESGNQAVDQISFTISGGQQVAFVGPSGAGKTTVIKLLVGLYKPGSGTISFNGIDSRQLNLVNLRQKIGLVSQDTQLFAGTIRDNLLFANPQASEQQCLQALDAAAASKLLERSSESLDTKIGEGGLKLSGGEKQRLAIARALLRQPNLLIFDEATSSLDSLTEQEIIETIATIAKKFPQLITVQIAHRLSTIIGADTIYVLEKGQISESGSHDELLKKQGLYSALWRQQIASRS